MKRVLYFSFYFKLPNGEEIEREIKGNTFEECLNKAQQRAARKNAEITAWIEL